MYGSHSAAFTSTVSTVYSPLRSSFSLAHVGKAAPPSPTHPLSRTACKNSSAELITGTLRFGSFSIKPSLAMWIACTDFPPARSSEEISVTVPETEACTGEENLPSSLAISCPT